MTTELGTIFMFKYLYLTEFHPIMFSMYIL